MKIDEDDNYLEFKVMSFIEPGVRYGYINYVDYDYTFDEKFICLNRFENTLAKIGLFEDENGFI